VPREWPPWKGVRMKIGTAYSVNTFKSAMDELEKARIETDVLKAVKSIATALVSLTLALSVNFGEVEKEIDEIKRKTLKK
jgi:hypothetical protein